MKKLASIVLTLSLVFIGSWGAAFGATILTTNSSDTLSTFRTNVNTSLTNLNSALGGGLATSTSETIGQLAYWTSTGATPATLGKVATTTISLSGPLLFSATQGALVGGSNTTLTWTGLATTSALTQGQLLYNSTGGNGVQSVATTTLTFSGFPANFPSTYGTLVGGSNTTFTYWGLATSTAIAANQVLYGTSVSGVGSEAAFTYNPTTDLFTTTLASTTQFSAASQTFYIDSTGHITAKDTVSSYSGVLSPTRIGGFGWATTTTWTGTTSRAYQAASLVLAPFTGTLRQIQCFASTTASFLGVSVYINSTLVTPSYFVASSTRGIITLTGNNTFSRGDLIGAYVGTTTSDSNALSGGCNYFATETP